MAQPADSGSKKLISLAPVAWAQWVTGRTDVVAREVLSSEFQWIGRDTDALIRAHSPYEGEFLIVNEVQLHYNDHMPRRMQAYAALAEEKFRLPVYPVLINILPPPATVTILDHYQARFMGLVAQRSFRVINLWEIDVAMVFAQPFPSLLPFVPVLQGGGDEQVIRKALHLLRQDQHLNELETLLAFFASFVLDIPVIQQIMRWDMSVLEQSPWYQEIEQRGWQRGKREGLAEGRQEGLAEGLAEGRQAERLHILLRIIEKRFGPLPPDLPLHLRHLDALILEGLIDAALTADSLTSWLAQVPDWKGQRTGETPTE